MQIADLLVWSIFQSLEHNNSDFIDLIKNKNVIEDVVIDRLYKLRLVAVGAHNKATTQAVILARKDYQHQLRELELLADTVISKCLKSKIAIYRVEELREHIGRLCDDKVMVAALLALVVALRTDGVCG